MREKSILGGKNTSSLHSFVDTADLRTCSQSSFGRVSARGRGTGLRHSEV